MSKAKVNKQIKVYFFGNPSLSPFITKSDDLEKLEEIEDGYLTPQEIPLSLFEHLDGQFTSEKIAGAATEDVSSFDFV